MNNFKENNPLRKLFADFLRENSAYDQFVTNYYKDKYSTTIGRFLDGNARYWVQMAFLWDKTTEGRPFWVKINNKWAETYEEYKSSTRK